MGYKRKKFQQEDSLKHYYYPEEMQYYICALVPNNITREILKDSCKFSLKEFCEAFQIKLL